MKTQILTVTVLLVLGAGNANAQDSMSDVPAIRQDNGYNPGWLDHSSTAAEGYLRGLADLTRSQGDYNYQTSLALINREVARKRYLENRDRLVKTYFETRRANEMYRDAERGTPLTSDQLAGIARATAPKRMNGNQLEPVLGTINWPETFTGTQFAAARDQLNKLFADRRHVANGTGSTMHREVVKATEQMKNELKGRMSEMPSMEYVAARKFLDSLAYEAQMIPGVEGIAAK